MGTDQQIEGQRRELARSLDYLTSAELRMLAGITEKTEEAWRKRHIGPAYVVVLNPADWLVVTTATGTDGHYLGGSYLGTMPMEMRGLRVSLSPSVDAGKALLIDTAHVELLIVDGFNIEVAYDGNDFTKNLVTMLGEMRVIPIFMTTGAARLITPKAGS